MIQVETSNNAATGTQSSEKMMERRVSFSSPGSDISSLSSPGSDSDSSHPSPTKQSAFSAVVKVSKMQANFAERTAAEMEEILGWYNKYEGVDRLKKENQQIQFMPHNAMIGVDDNDENNGEESEKENEDGNNTEEEDQGHEIQVGDEEFVMVKDYHTPSQKSKSTTPSSFQKKTTSLLVSTVRSISIARKKHDPPPIAIKLSSEDEDDAAVLPLSSNLNTDDSMKQIHPPSTVTVSSMHDNSIQEELTEYRDQEEEVLAMLSPCSQPKAPTIITKPDDDEDELMELLLSPTSCSSKSVSSFGGRKSPVSDSNDSVSDRSTGEEAHSQIKAAEDLIRNTQNMAEIIAQLQQSSSLPFREENGDNEDDNKINETPDDISSRRDEFETFQTPVTKNGMRNRFYKPRTRDRRHSNSSIVSKVSKNSFSRFLGRQLDRFVMSIVLSLAVGLVLKFIIA